MMKNKNVTNEELRAGYRFGSRSILLQFFLFLFFSERFVNLINITQEMKIIPLPSDFATYLFSTSTALRHCYWCPMSLPLVNVTLIVNLLCEICKFSLTFSVKTVVSEALKLFFWDPPLMLLQD